MKTGLQKRLTIVSCLTFSIDVLVYIYQNSRLFFMIECAKDIVDDWVYENRERIGKWIMMITKFSRLLAWVFRDKTLKKVDELDAQIFLYRCVKNLRWLIGKTASEELIELMLYGVECESNPELDIVGIIDKLKRYD